MFSRSDFTKIYNVIKYPTTLAILVTGLCFFCFSFLEEEYALSARLIIFAVCYICTIAASAYMADFCALVNSLRYKIAFVFVWLYGTFALVGIGFIDQSELIVSRTIVHFVLNCIWTFPVMVCGSLILYHIVKYVSKEVLSPGGPFSRWVLILMFVGIVFAGMLMLYAFNPAITSPDSEECYAHAYNIIIGLPIDDDHPFFYKFLLSIFLRIYRSISFLIIVQTIFFAAVFVKGICFIRKLGISKKTCLIIYFFFGLGYNTIIQLSTLWKDIPYTASMLWLIILVAESVCFNENPGFLWCVGFVISSVFVSFIRHGGFAPVFITIILLFLLSNEKKRIGFSVLAVIALSVLIRGPLYKALNVDSGTVSGLKYQALVADVEYVYYNGGQMTDEGAELAQLVADGEDYVYNTWYTENAFWKINDYPTGKFIKVYFITFLKNPILMSKGIILRNNYLWAFKKPIYGHESCVARLTESHVYEDTVSLTIPYRQRNFLTNIFVFFIDGFSWYDLIHSVYWRVGIYTFAILIMIMMIISRLWKRALWFLLPFLPIVINDMILVLSCGGSNYRYYWPNMILCSVLIPYGIIAAGKSYNSSTD